MMDVLFWAFIYGAMIPFTVAGFAAAIIVLNIAWEVIKAVVRWAAKSVRQWKEGPE